MSTRPRYQESLYSPRELICGAYIAAGLWVLSLALLAGMAAWATAPNWTA
jgi:hypothetical protein